MLRRFPYACLRPERGARPRPYVPSVPAIRIPLKCSRLLRIGPYYNKHHITSISWLPVLLSLRPRGQTSFPAYNNFWHINPAFYSILFYTGCHVHVVTFGQSLHQHPEFYALPSSPNIWRSVRPLLVFYISVYLYFELRYSTHDIFASFSLLFRSFSLTLQTGFYRPPQCSIRAIARIQLLTTSKTTWPPPIPSTHRTPRCSLRTIARARVLPSSTTTSHPPIPSLHSIQKPRHGQPLGDGGSRTERARALLSTTRRASSVSSTRDDAVARRSYCP